MTRRARLAMRLLRLYPRAWRDRYEPEVCAVLEEHPVGLFTLADLVAGAIAARLEPAYRTREGTMPRPERQTQRRYTRCSFCGKGPDQVRKLIAGPGVYICNSCIELCNEVLARDDSPRPDPTPPPPEPPTRHHRVSPRSWLRNLFRSTPRFDYLRGAPGRIPR